MIISPLTAGIFAPQIEQIAPIARVIRRKAEKASSLASSSGTGRAAATLVARAAEDSASSDTRAALAKLRLGG